MTEHEERPAPRPAGERDPARPGTVYRARPGWQRVLADGGRRLRRPVASSGPPVAGTRQADALPPDDDPWPPLPRPDAAPLHRSDAAPRTRYDVPPAEPLPRSVPGGPSLGTVRSRRRRRPRLAGLLVAVLLLLVGYPLALGATAWSHLNRVSLRASSLPETPGRTWLVVGSDARDQLTKAERRRLHTGSTGGRRTDTIMLLHVPDGGGPVALVSIPRDSYVSIPGHGKNKINAAFAFGGPDLLARTIEQATGVRVDSYAETGLGGFADVVDAVGGVRVCVKKAMKDADAHVDLKAGCQIMDGPTALGYARARHSQARGDLDRVEHQRQVLAAIASRAASPSVAVNPFEAFRVARAGGGALTVDDDASPWAVTGFVRAMRAAAGGNGVELTVPVSRADLRTSAGLAVAWDKAEAAKVFAAIRADDTERLRAVAAAQDKARG